MWLQRFKSWQQGACRESLLACTLCLDGLKNLQDFLSLAIATYGI